MAGGSVYLNGEVIPAERARVSVTDAGFLHGASAFTTMLAHNGVVFRLDRHIARLMETARLLSLQTDVTPESLTAAIGEVLKANELAEARMRITLTPGSVRGGEPTTLVMAETLPEYPKDWYEKGITVAISSFKQLAGAPMFGYKTGCYLPRMLARQEAAAKGAAEAIWLTTDNRLAEACFCNVFLVRAGQVYTPPLDTPVLPGVVREAVIEICENLNIQCHSDKALTVRDMLSAEGMFLTASCSGIRPVVCVERHAVGGEKPGDVTISIMKAYRELLDAECKG
ncbi:MAG: aminotransferase class IV family protein [Phycisphaerae bacterium]|nr:aminotransferase class IV family protein [Phycisphaerae bacterium]